MEAHRYSVYIYIYTYITTIIYTYTLYTYFIDIYRVEHRRVYEIPVAMHWKTVDPMVFHLGEENRCGEVVQVDWQMDKFYRRSILILFIFMCSWNLFVLYF